MPSSVSSLFSPSKVVVDGPRPRPTYISAVPRGIGAMEAEYLRSVSNEQQESRRESQSAPRPALVFQRAPRTRTAAPGAPSQGALYGVVVFSAVVAAFAFAGYLKSVGNGYITAETRGRVGAVERTTSRIDHEVMVLRADLSGKLSWLENQLSLETRDRVAADDAMGARVEAVGQEAAGAHAALGALAPEVQGLAAAQGADERRRKAAVAAASAREKRKHDATRSVYRIDMKGPDGEYAPICSAFAISKNGVLATNAHCAAASAEAAALGMKVVARRAGSLDEFAVESAKVHPKYVDGQQGNDVAVLRLAMGGKRLPAAAALASVNNVAKAAPGTPITLLGFSGARTDPDFPETEARRGVVTRNVKNDPRHPLDHDAEVAPGLSASMMLGDDGRVLGLNMGYLGDDGERSGGFGLGVSIRALEDIGR